MLRAPINLYKNYIPSHVQCKLSRNSLYVTTKIISVKLIEEINHNPPTSPSAFTGPSKQAKTPQ
jgi:hypothetical protein